MPVRSFLWLTDFAISKQNGEVIRLYNQQGELHWLAAKASLWGHLRNSNYARSIDPSLGFAGQLRDDESGLCYNRFRYYDPQAACYISPDPIGILGGENNYGYVPNPVNWIDPLGLKCSTLKKGDDAILGPHGTLKNDPRPGQSHHLNQDAAYRDIIPTNSGAAIKLEGNAFTQPNTAHYKAHKSLEKFWDKYRRGGALSGQRPTNIQYTQALKRSLEDAGLSAKQVNQAVRSSIKNRIQHGALGGQHVPRIPGRINQVKL